MPPFLICIHDVTPAHEQATRAIVRDLAPLIGRRLSLGVVPDWHGRWPLAAHPGYCEFVRHSAEEVLLHGYFHRRRRGRGPVSLLAEGSDEMNGLDPEETRRTLERGQQLFAELFGARPRGFLAPAWQRGHVRPGNAGTAAQVDHVLGFFAIESSARKRVPIATWTWDCGRWARLGHAGDALGRVLRSIGGRVPSLAIHPRDLERGFWPRILEVTHALLEAGHEPATVAQLLEAKC